MFLYCLLAEESLLLHSMETLNIFAFANVIKYFVLSLRIFFNGKFHWQFLITNFFSDWLNILLRKFDTSSKKEMKKIKTQTVWWKITTTKKRRKCMLTQSSILYSELISQFRDVMCTQSSILYCGLAPLTRDILSSKL